MKVEVVLLTAGFLGGLLLAYALGKEAR